MTPTRKIAEFLPIMLPFAPGLPRMVAEQNLRLAAIEFCERTRAWRYITSIDVEEQGQIIVAPDYATIHEIETARFDGADLIPIQFSHVDGRWDDVGANNGQPTYITQASPNTVMLLPFLAGRLHLSLFLKPRSGQDYTRDTFDSMHDYYNQVPEHLFVQHAETIVSGALARALLIPGQPYTNPGLAAINAERFERGCNNFFSRNMTGQQRARRRTRFNDF